MAIAAKCDLLKTLDERQLLEGTADNWLGIEPQPSFNHSAVDAPEINAKVQVALQQIAFLKGRVLTVHSASDSIAYRER